MPGCRPFVGFMRHCSRCRWDVSRTQSKLGIVFLVGLLSFGLPSCQTIAPPPEPPALSPAVTVTQEVRQALEAAQALRHAGHYEAALKAFAEVILRYPDQALTANALLATGQLASDLGQFSKAQTYYRTLLHRFPRSDQQAAAQLGLGIALYNTQDYEASRAALQSALSADPSLSHRVRYTEAEIALAQGQYRQAVETFVSLADTSDDATLSQSARERVGAIVADRLSLSDLAALSARYPTTFPGDLLLARLAQEYRRTGDLAQEAEVLQRFLSAFPHHPDAPSAQTRWQYIAAAVRTDASKLGVILPLSGPAEEAGKRALWGLQLALAHLQDRYPSLSLSLVIRDEGDTTAVAQAALRSLVEETRVIGVIGPLLSQTAEALAPLTEQLAVPLISPYARDSDFPAHSTYAFRNSLTDAMQGQELAAYAINTLALQRFAVLYPNDAYGKALSDHFSAHIKALQGQMIIAVSYRPDSTDFRPAIARLQGLRYDALFVPDYADNIVRLLPTLRRSMPQGVQLLGSDGWNAPELTTLTDGSVDGAVFVDGFFAQALAPQVQTFVNHFSTRYGEVPGLLAAQAYDALVMCGEVLQAGATTRYQLREGLLQIRDFPGVSGLTRVEDNGDMSKQLYVLTIRHGQIVEVLPHPRS